MNALRILIELGANLNVAKPNGMCPLLGAGDTYICAQQACEEQQVTTVL